MRVWLVVTVAVTSLASCSDTGNDLFGGNAEDRAEAQQAVGSTELTRLEGSLLAVISDSVPLDQEPSAMATAVAAAAPSSFTPSACVTAQTAGTSVTYTFENCSGAYGLSSVSGTATLVFGAPGIDSIALTFTATGIAANDATVTINATGDYSSQNGEQRLALTTTGGGTTSGGAVVGRAGAYTMTWDDAQCITLDGQWTTSVSETFFTTVVSSYEQCGTSCPASGNIAYGRTTAPETATDPMDGSGIVISFDGDNTAGFVSPRSVGEVTLACQG